jgi:hypothetical protein
VLQALELLDCWLYIRAGTTTVLCTSFLPLPTLAYLWQSYDSIAAFCRRLQVAQLHRKFQQRRQVAIVVELFIVSVGTWLELLEGTTRNTLLTILGCIMF